MAVPALSTNSPSVGSIAWAAFNIQYGGVAYSVSAGSTSQRFVWWRYNAGSPLLEAGADVPANLTIDDLILFGNKNGTPINLQTAGLVEGGLIVDGSIFADALAANSVTAVKILAGSIDATKIAAHTITADEIMANAITADALAANSVSSDKIQANSVSAVKLGADIVTAGKIVTGPDGVNRVGMDSAGFFAETVNPTTLVKTRTVDIPTTGSPTFRGKIEAESALFTGGFEARGASTGAPGGSLQMRSAQGAPATAPQVTPFRQTVNGPNLYLDKPTISGVWKIAEDGIYPPVWDPNAAGVGVGRWIQVVGWTTDTHTNKTWAFSRTSTDAAGVRDASRSGPFGSLTAGVESGNVFQSQGAFRLGAHLFVGYGRKAGTEVEGTLVGFNLTTGFADVFSFTPGNSDWDGACWGTDGTDLWLMQGNYGPSAKAGGLTGVPTNSLYAVRYSWAVNGSGSGSLTSTDTSVKVGQVLTGDSLHSYPQVASLVVSRTAGSAAFDYPAVSGQAVMNITTKGDSKFFYGQRSMWCSFVPGTANQFVTFIGSWYGNEQAGIGWNSADGYFWGGLPVYVSESFARVQLIRQGHDLSQGQDFEFYHTWYDDNVASSSTRHETTLSPSTVIRSTGRDDHYVTTGIVPGPVGVAGNDDVTGARFYVRNTLGGSTFSKINGVLVANTATGAISAYGYVAGAVGSNIVVMRSGSLPGNVNGATHSLTNTTGVTQPPSINSFALVVGTPFVIMSQTAGITLRGDGTATLGTIEVVPSAATVTDPLAPTDLSNKRYVDRLNGGSTGIHAHRERQTGQATANATDALMDFSTVISETGIAWDSTNKLWTIPTPGRYSINGAVHFDTNSSGWRRVRLSIGRSGTETVRALGQVTAAAAAGVSASFAVTLRLLQNDTVKMFAAQGSGGGLNTYGDTTSAATYFTIAYLGP